MQKTMNIRSTGLTHVRKSGLMARITMVLAGSSMAGALLIGGLFGLHSNQAFTNLHAAKSGFATTGMIVPVQNALVSSKNITVSYQVPSQSRARHSTYRDIAYVAAVKAGINPRYFIKQIQQESGFNPWAVSPAGAEGIAQFMPATAASMGVDPWNPVSALYGAANLMASLKREFRGNYAMALGAYNAGPGAVRSAIARGGNNWYFYLPNETRHYITIIMER